MAKKQAKKPPQAPHAWTSKIVGHDRVAPDQLIANPLNFRKHPQAQRDALRDAIAEVGFIRSVTVNKRTGNLIDGHERVWQALTTEQPLIDVEYVDLSEEDEKKALATMDPISEMAQVDGAALDLLLRDVQTGSEALQTMLAELAADANLYEGGSGEVVEDEVPEAPADPITKPGDLWLLGEHRLLCGDSTKAEDVGRLMNGERAWLVCTDPPYGVDYVGKTSKKLVIANDGREGLGALLGEMFRQALSVTHPGAVWYVTAPAGPQFGDFAAPLAELGIWRQTLVWAKQSLVMGHSDYHYQHEAIFYGWSPGAAHQPPPDRKQTTLWEIDRPTASRDHPTTKPVELFARCIGNSTLSGQIVFEPCSGSGTTIIAAEQLHRRCFAMEISPAYCDVAVTRWEKLTGQKAELAQ